MSSKQTTLFQTWGYEGNSYLSQPKSSQPPKKSPAETAFLQVQNDEDDALLAEALEKSLHEASRDPVNFEELPAIPNTQATEQIPGFDLTSGRTWIYPTNYPVRTYQYDIVQSSLFDNTLVSLPTGLGKTFIAAVVMYNFYRWYPRGKVVFMAPTKPLVTQQIEACYNIMGIPQDETSVMTGNVAVSTRAKAWQQKRVFFMTPQVMSNDLARGLFPASEVKLLVVDEAHRAQGDYAYCQVVKELQKSRASFRVVALSATPGSDLQAVRMMLQNLVISRIELRNEDSPDIVPYTFKRKIDKIVVPISGELKAMKEKFLTILEIFIKRLAKVNALSRRGNSTNPLHYTKFGILQSRDEFRQNPPGRLDNHQKGVVEGDFSSAMTLYHAYDLLVLHGLRSFYNFMAKSAGETSDSPNTTNTSLGGGAGGSSSPATSTYVNRRLKYDLNRMPMWSEIMTELKEKFSGDFSNIRLGSKGPQLLSQFGAASKSQGSIEKEMPLGHPKLEKLRDVVTAHFEAKKEIETRVMIFSQYRDSVQEIAALLHQYRPLVKVMEFVGQSGTAGKKGLTQKEQIEVVRRFREGGYNTLVATCVGEEGLDIGDVDLIVCYDVSKSPIRLVQRMGRTGRKREGRIIVLVAEGKEEQNYNQSMYCKNSINKAILEKHKLVNFLTLAPRMVPKGIDPVCHKMVMKVGTFVSAKSGKSNIGPEKNKKITSMMKKGVDKVTSYRKSCGYLTDAEYEEFAKMYPNCEDLFANVPKIPKRKELWAWSKGDILENIIEQNDQRKVEKNEYSFADWNLWQNSISSRFLVSQSSKSKIFCEILRKEEPPVQDEQIVPVNEDLADEDNDDEITFLNCSPVQVQPMETEEDEEVVFVPIESDANTEVPERQNIFGDLLEDDPANKLYGTDEYFNRVTDKIDRMIKALENRTIPKFDVTEALCNFRKTKRNQNRAMDLDRRSPSPVYLSQAEVLEKSQETSTPMAPCSSKTMIPKSVDPITPVTRRSKRHASLNNCSAFDDSFVQVSDIQDESKRLSSIATPKSSQIRSKSLFSNDDKENAVEGKRISQNNSAFNDSFVSLSTIQDKLDNPETSQKVGNISFYNESQLASMLEPSQCLKNLSDEHQVSKNNVDIIEEIKQEKTEHFTHEEPISDYGSEHDQNNDEEIVAELDLRNFCDFDEFCENLVKLQTVTRKVTPESVKSVKSQKVKQETPESVKSQMVRRKESPECEAILRQIEIKVEKHFKMPNLQDFESRARVTPKALKFTQSPVIPIKAKKRAIISSSDEENSADEALNSDKDDSPIIRKPKLKKPRNKFIDDEAELSGDGSEDDEHSNENLDTYDQSFLDDDGDHGIPDLDEKAIYLRSIKSPELNFRKLKPLKPMAKEDIYSQEVTDSMMLDDYQEDSFCVENSDEIEYADSPDELDFVPEFEEGEKPKKNKTLAVAKKRKRILMSSSDEEEVRIVTPPAVSKVSMTIATPPAVSKVSVSSVSSLSTPKNVSSATSKSVLSFQASPGSVSISAQDKSVTSVTTKNSVTPSKLQKSKVVPGVPQCGVTIVANPTEVHKSHDLISSLKHIHGLTVCVQKGFDSAGYLLSTRLAVSLVKNSDLCNGAQRHKLVQIVQTLNEYYERGFLIIETSNSNQFLEMRHNRSKYIDMIICQLATSNIRILYSQTIEQTSGLIAKLAKKEARKHFALPANLKLPELSEDFVPMYQEIPGVSLALAMRMCISFENPSELFSAALATLIRKLKIDEKRAQKIHEFCRHELKIDNVSDGEDDSE